MLKTNKNFAFIKANQKAKRQILLQGGTRSGKTYAAIHFLISLYIDPAHANAGMVASICRRTMPALRASAMRDFFDIIKDWELYNEDDHNKSEHIYTLNGNIVEFVNLDDEQKVRGRKRHILIVDEANEVSHEVIRQLLFRTSGLSIFCYNPSITEDHWLISDMLARPKAARIITTYLDNPALSASQVEEIESLQKSDPMLWRVFGLGQIGDAVQGLVFPSWGYGFDMEAKAQVAFGLDFGYSPDPTALIELRIIGKEMHVRQWLYARELSASDIVKHVKTLVPKGVELFCDNRKDIIADLQRGGVNAKAAVKGADSIDFGVKLMKGYKISVHEDSIDLQRELKYYSYKKDANGHSIGGAYSDIMNHAIDAWRYAAMGMVARGSGLIRTAHG